MSNMEQGKTLLGWLVIASGLLLAGTGIFLLATSDGSQTIFKSGVAFIAFGALLTLLFSVLLLNRPGNRRLN